jgi:catechol 2,3-dioxygenase-like lactoylglutathione lyase family enzyme
VELWVPDLAAATRSWGWLLGELGWTPYQDWDAGRSWRLGASYLVFEQSPARSGDAHDRLAPGLNHLAFHTGPPAEVDRLTAAAAEHGWTLLFPDRHPYARGRTPTPPTSRTHTATRPSWSPGWVNPRRVGRCRG